MLYTPLRSVQIPAKQSEFLISCCLRHTAAIHSCRFFDVTGLIDVCVSPSINNVLKNNSTDCQAQLRAARKFENHLQGGKREEMRLGKHDSSRLGTSSLGASSSRDAKDKSVENTEQAENLAGALREAAEVSPL